MFDSFQGEPTFVKEKVNVIYLLIYFIEVLSDPDDHQSSGFSPSVKISVGRGAACIWRLVRTTDGKRPSRSSPSLPQSP